MILNSATLGLKTTRNLVESFNISTPPLDLVRLLEPVTPHTFFKAHWEREPLHLNRAAAHYYEDLLKIGDLERLIASPEAHYPAVQLSKHCIGPGCRLRSFAQGSKSNSIMWRMLMRT